MQITPEISVIICSIDENRYNECVGNFKTTIGVEAEFIRIDNKLHKWPIAKAYNEGARQAKAPNLLFIHEDVLFESKGWGKAIVGKLAEPDCGVIGFVGSPFRVDALSAWIQYKDQYYGNLTYVDNNQRRKFFCEPWPKSGTSGQGAFAPVIVVDGLALAVRKDVWHEYPFAEDWLPGFHCYDIDFCLQIAARYRNWVYLRAEVCHYSNGSYGTAWVADTLRLTERRWKSMLPMAIGNLPVSATKIQAHSDYYFTCLVLRNGIESSMARKVVGRYVRKSFQSRHHFRHLFTVVWKYFIKYVI